MKQFFKFTFASMLGFILASFIGIFLFGVIFSAIVSSSQQPSAPKVSSNSILHVKLEKRIVDQPTNNPFENFDFGTFEDKTPLSLEQIVSSIQRAKSNNNIKGIYLDVQNLQANLASTEEIRNALIDFKSSGKFIISYNEFIGQNEYYLCSVADEIYLNPAGGMTFKGLSAQLMFFKDALERLEIDMQVVRHGKFKGAIEPFIRNEMSEENKFQISAWVNSIWNHQLNGISSSRSIEVTQLNTIADELAIRKTEDALEHGLIDGLKYEDEVWSMLATKVNLEADDRPKTISLKRFSKVRRPKVDSSTVVPYMRSSKNRIAVIYAEGEIVSGESRDGTMGSETIAEALKEAREDDRVKAIVFRVNSPGGSALASDVIWREAELAKAEKPLVVSMGDYAASGGYYISSPANKIFAENTTITGSIGVFGLIPNMKGLFNNKLGIHIDKVNTNSYSDGLSGLRPMEKTEHDAIKEMIEKVYDDFTNKVADGRGMTQAEVDSVGQGRVWTGIMAKEIGLVDEIGGLQSAINEAINLAEILDYKIKELPAQEDPFEKMMKELSLGASIQIFGDNYGIAEKYYSNIKRVISSEGIYTRMPVDIIFD